MKGNILEPWPYGMNLAFAIRDDDISYFTKSKQIEKIYSDAFKSGFKISFAVIPNHKASLNPNVPPEYRGKNCYFPINENIELVSYLRDKIKRGTADILQHGYAHTEDYDYSLSEFDSLSQDETRVRLIKGKQLLENTFDKTVKCFVAPQEHLTSQLLSSIKEIYPYYCGGIVKAPWFYWFKLLIRSNGKIWLGVRTLRNGGINSVPLHLMPSYRHYWNQFDDDLKAKQAFATLKRIIDRTVDQKGYFILLTHYWEYFYDWSENITRNLQCDYLKKTLNYVNGLPNVWKCTITELARWLKARKSLRVAKKRNELIINSPYNLNGLAIRSFFVDDHKMEAKAMRIKKRNREFVVLTINAGQVISLRLKERGHC